MPPHTMAIFYFQEKKNDYLRFLMLKMLSAVAVKNMQIQWMLSGMET